MAQIAELALAGMIEETAKILEGVDDVPFGEGEVGVVLRAAIALLFDRGQGHRVVRPRPFFCATGLASPLDIGERRQDRERDQGYQQKEKTAQAPKHVRAVSAAPADSRSGWRCRQGRDAARWRRSASRAAS